MLYDFKCQQCNSIHACSFSANAYDNYVADDGRLKRRKCPQCKTISLYRYISSGTIPSVMGGSRNYMSMERYWAQNKGELRRKEDEIASTLAQRHIDRVTSRIDKQQERQGSDKRNEGYGEGSGEQRLKSE